MIALSHRIHIGGKVVSRVHPRRPSPLLAAVWLALLAVSNVGRADPVIFAFRGEVTGIFDGLGALPPETESARTFAGYYIFDSDTPNSSDFHGEGYEGIYHHTRPPAGVVVRVGHNVFATNPLRPDFDIVVRDSFGFVGADEYGFTSRNNVGRFLPPRADRLDISWLASTFQANPIEGVELPLVPPNLRELGGGQFNIYGECTPCAAPAAFFRVEGTLTSLRRVGHRADMNGDGVVDRLDLAELVRNFGMAPHAIMTDGDLDDDGMVGLADLGALHAAFGYHGEGGVTPVTPVPEPTGMALAALTLVGLALHRRQSGVQTG